MNHVDKQYQDLLIKILEKGRQKGDRTGTGTISIPFATIDIDMSEGFPLLTTKKMYFKGIVTELIWFLRGDTNIKFLVDNGCHIWDGDAYKNYLKEQEKAYKIEYDKLSSNGLFEINLDWQNFSQEEFINKIKTDDEFAKKWGSLGPVYGKQWRSWAGKRLYTPHTKADESFIEIKIIDQIANLINDLKTNPDSRRLMVNAWNVGELDQMALPPCHYGFQLYSEELTWEERKDLLTEEQFRDEFGYISPFIEPMINHYLDSKNVPKRRLSLIWDQRSCDTFLGIPFNIASYGILLHMFAQQANMVPDRLIGSLKNVHVYNNHIEQCKEQIAREPRELPKLVLNKAKDIFSYTYDDIQIVDYNPHDKIVGDISV